MTKIDMEELISDGDGKGWEKLSTAVATLQEELRQFSVSLMVGQAFNALRAGSGASATSALKRVALTAEDEELLETFGLFLTRRAQSRRAAKNIGAGYAGG